MIPRLLRTADRALGGPHRAGVGHRRGGARPRPAWLYHPPGPWCGLGLGSVLLRRCLRDLAAQGRHAAVIPWVGPLAFYAHHAGADVARVFYRYEKNLP